MAQQLLQISRTRIRGTLSGLWYSHFWPVTCCLPSFGLKWHSGCHSGHGHRCTVSHTSTQLGGLVNISSSFILFFCFFNRYATTGQWTPEAFRYFSSQVFGDNWKGRKFLFIFILLNKFWLIFFKLFTELARLFVCTRLDYLFFNMLPIKKTWTELTPGTTLLPSFAKLMARKKIIIANVFTFLLGTKLLLILPT